MNNVRYLKINYSTSPNIVVWSTIMGIRQAMIDKVGHPQNGIMFNDLTISFCGTAIQTVIISAGGKCRLPCSNLSTKTEARQNSPLAAPSCPNKSCKKIRYAQNLSPTSRHLNKGCRGYPARLGLMCRGMYFGVSRQLKAGSRV
jgi:hypothetical protein